MIEVLKPVIFKVESQSQTPSLRLKRWYQCNCARTILTTLTILCTVRSMQLLGMWSSFHKYNNMLSVNIATSMCCLSEVFSHKGWSHIPAVLTPVTRIKI